MSSLVAIFFCLVSVSHFLKTMKNYFAILDFPVIVIFYRMKKSINKQSDFLIYPSLIIIHRVLLVLVMRALAKRMALGAKKSL